MKKLLLLFLLFTIYRSPFTGLHAQNLVPNPSFEDYTICPDNQCQIIRATNWKSFGYSPDYFNACTTNPLYSVPYNCDGYQFAASGVAYAGLYVYNYSTSYKREYIGVELSETLNIGKKYYFQMKVARPFGSGIYCATNNIGVLFSTVSYEILDTCGHTTPSALNNPINYANIYDNNIITDTANWTTVDGSFIADSAYRYIVIGNFFDNASTQYVIDSGNYCIAYYWIDDVYLSTDSVINIPEEQLENNQFIIYPNPSDYYFQITVINNESTYYCNFYNSYGRLIRQLINPSIVNVTDFPSGIYLLQININNKIVNKKIIINH